MEEKKVKKKQIRKRSYTCCICNKNSVTRVNTLKCPKCGVKYWNKPINEHTLLSLQDDYLRTRDQKYLSEMSPMLMEMVRNLIVSKLKKSGKFIPPEDIEDKSMDTILTLMEYYITKENFKIEHSFNGYIGKVVLYPLYNKKDRRVEESEMSMHTVIKAGAEGELTIEDMLSVTVNSGIFSEDWLLSNWQKDAQVEIASGYLEEVFTTAVRDRGLTYALFIMRAFQFKLDEQPDRVMEQLFNNFKDYDFKRVFYSLWNNFRSFLKIEILLDESNDYSISEDDRAVAEG